MPKIGSSDVHGGLLGHVMALLVGSQSVMKEAV